MTITGRSLAQSADRPLAGLDSLLHWVVRLVWLNVCWIALTLLGGVVLGMGPATVAAYAVGEQWARGEKDLSVGSVMWTQWRRHFRRANAVTLLATALVGALLASWWLSRGQGPIPAAITQGMAMLGLLLIAATVPHLPWVTALVEQTTDRRLSRVFAMALAIGIGRPVLTLVMLVITVGWPVVLIASGWPGLLPVTGVSVPVAACAHCIYRTRRPPTASDVHAPLPPHHPDERTR